MKEKNTKTYHSTIAGCTSTEPRQMDISKNTLNSKSYIPKDK